MKINASKSDFVISDTHFGHRNIIAFCSRPFNNIMEHDAALIKNWNSRVGPNDRVFHIGDFALCSKKYIEKVLDQLNGKKYLVLGSHDKESKLIGLNKFELITKYLEVVVPINNKDILFVMFHNPIENWEKKHYGSIHLHGHVHKPMRHLIKNRMDVGVDLNNYSPLRFDEAFQKANQIETTELICNVQ